MLCTCGIETHLHLFFEYHYSATVWRKVLARNGILREGGGGGGGGGAFLCLRRSNGLSKTVKVKTLGVLFSNCPLLLLSTSFGVNEI